jgi:hypothetical protein
MSCNVEPSRAVTELYNHFGTWQKVADYINSHLSGVSVSVALAWKVGKGRVDSPVVRQALGLPPREVMVPTCPQCGEVHTKKGCVYNRKRDARVRRAWAGSGRDAVLLDAIIAERGFNSLREWMDWEISVRGESIGSTVVLHTATN